MKPAIIVSVCNRLFELSNNLQRIAILKREFYETPKIVVVWAAGNSFPHMQSAMDEMLAKGLMDQLVIRKALYNEHEVGIPYLESINVQVERQTAEQLGVDYVVRQTADVFVAEGTYQSIDMAMAQGYEGVAYNWAYPLTLYTNFFALKTNSKYWPGIIQPKDHNVLEWHFGVKALQLGISQLYLVDEPEDKGLFYHRHERDLQEKWLKENPINGSSNSNIQHGK